MRGTRKKSLVIVGLIIVIAVVAVLLVVFMPKIAENIRNARNEAILQKAGKAYEQYVSEHASDENFNDSGWIAVVRGGKCYYVKVVDGEIQIEDEYSKDKKGKRIITWSDHTFHAYYNGFCVCGAVDRNNVVIHRSLDVYEHTLNEQDGTVLLTKYIGSDTDVTVPDIYVIKGKKYRPVLDSTTVFAGNSSITSVTVSYGVGYKSNTMKLLFSDCVALRFVDLSDADTFAVVSMKRMFYNCKSLEGLNLSGIDTCSLKDMTQMFAGSNSNIPEKLKIIDLSGWDMSRVVSTVCCFQRSRAEKIILPDNISVISEYCFNHVDRFAAKSFTVPAGVKKIGLAHAFYNFGTGEFSEFAVADGNGYYKAIDGVLYTKDGTRLIAVPKGKTFENNTFVIPEGVTLLGELSFSRNKNIETLVIPNSLAVEYVGVENNLYKIDVYDTGNLNGGNILNIAVYYYCENLSAYEVKSDNTRYTAENGILYSKDKTEVVAIPVRYRGEIVIPEGVTTWREGAFYIGDRSESDNKSFANTVTLACTGVHIPSSLTDIDKDELETLNWLVDQYKAGERSEFVITVEDGNASFEVDGNGHLVRK